MFVLFRNLGKTAYNEALAFLGQALQAVIGQRAPQQQQQQAGQAPPDVAWQVGLGAFHSTTQHSTRPYPTTPYHPQQ